MVLEMIVKCETLKLQENNIEENLDDF
jgi:hypothetical protein